MHEQHNTNSPSATYRTHFSPKLAVSSGAIFIPPSIYTILSPEMMILSIAPLITSLMISASPFNQFKQIIKTKCTSNYSSVPFFCLFNNAAIWAAYGILSGDYTLTMANTVMMVTSGVGISIFAMNNTNPSNQLLIKKYLIGTSIFMLTLPSSIVLMQNAEDMLNMLGSIGCLTSIIVYASPFAVIQNVIKNKSTSALPFGLTAALTLNAGTWVYYSCFVIHDMYVGLPCVVGFGLSLAQLSLFAIY